WAGSRGLLLARELFGSAVEVNLGLSVYNLASLRRTFDVILFLGGYYHLHDPFYAPAPVRQCCHADTLVLMEGNEAPARRPGTALYDFADHASEWLPSRGALEQHLRATYFTVEGRATLEPAPPPVRPAGRLGWRWRLH